MLLQQCDALDKIGSQAKSRKLRCCACDVAALACEFCHCGFPATSSTHPQRRARRDTPLRGYDDQPAIGNGWHSSFWSGPARFVRHPFFLLRRFSISSFLRLRYQRWPSPSFLFFLHNGGWLEAEFNGSPFCILSSPCSNCCPRGAFDPCGRTTASTLFEG